MIKWTTPNLKCIIPSDLNFDYLIITIKSNNSVIEKTFQFDEIQKEETEGETISYFELVLSQEETGEILGGKVEAQINFISGDTRLATNIENLIVSKNLHDEVI